MAWTSAPPIFSLMEELLLLKIRMERVSLIQKINALELQARAAGVDPTIFEQIRRQLVSTAPPLKTFNEELAAMPRKTRLTALRIAQKPGSKF